VLGGGRGGGSGLMIPKRRFSPTPNTTFAVRDISPEFHSGGGGTISICFFPGFHLGDEGTISMFPSRVSCRRWGDN
jgi:hypothetical protein